MRLKASNLAADSTLLHEYAGWIANIGDGMVNEPNDGVVSIDIPDTFLVDGGHDPIAAMVRKVYPDLHCCTFDKSYYEGRAILAPTLKVVQLVNNYMISLSTTEGRTYFSSDTGSRSDQGSGFMNDLHTKEFLNSISASGLPEHIMSLKVGVPVMLLRNIDPSQGLCNETRLLITRLGNHVLEGEILSSSSSNGKKILITRISLTPSDSRIPFKFERRQFSLMVSYAMSINKSQGQSLFTIGLMLKKLVFSHGQLYVALSRVTHLNDLHIWICDPAEESSSNKCTTNVVFKEDFQNI